MRYLALALFAEGPTDHGFLRRIIYRSVVEIGTRLSQQKLDVGERFVDGNRWTGADRTKRIEVAFAELVRQGAVNLLFIHADGAGDPDLARACSIDPAAAVLTLLNPDGFRSVAVVPVRETEAWALADPDALMAELGWNGAVTTLVPGLDLQRPEAILEPKTVLAACLSLATGRGRRGRRSRSDPIPTGLGDRVALPRLRRLKAFVTFEADLENALRSMWGVD